METNDTTPSNLGEVNITLKFLQRDLAKHGNQLEQVINKLDSMASNFTPLADFVTLKTEVEALKSKTNTFIDSWTGRVWGINLTISAIAGITILIISHYWK